MKQGTKLFGVQRIRRGAVAGGESTTVEAFSPVEAAEIVLGRRLVQSGPARNLRALVWHMEGDFNPVCTYLYKPASSKSLHRLTRGSMPSEREERKILGYIIAVSCAAALIVASLVLVL